MISVPDAPAAINALVEKIDAILPQTQCRRCDFPGCRPYAEAIVAGEADINQCPPGGSEGIVALADLLGVKPKRLNSKHGEERSLEVAFIVEEDCIGCVKCIQACPVDAIIGASKHMHTVITDECTGCELCIAPCPVDCIAMQSAPVLQTQRSGTKPESKQQRAERWRSRYESRLIRLKRDQRERDESLRKKKEALKKLKSAVIAP